MCERSVSEKNEHANVRTTTVPIHLLWQELLALFFCHLRPICILLYRSQYDGRLVIEDPLDQGHCQWDVGSDKEPYLNASTYALYSVIMG